MLDRLTDEMMETPEGRAELQALCDQWDEILRCGGLQ